MHNRPAEEFLARVNALSRKHATGRLVTRSAPDFCERRLAYCPYGSTDCC